VGFKTVRGSYRIYRKKSQIRVLQSTGDPAIEGAGLKSLTQANLDIRIFLPARGSVILQASFMWWQMVAANCIYSFRSKNLLV
jgi:hypothetical protein